MKKIVSLILSLTLLLTMVIPASAIDSPSDSVSNSSSFWDMFTANIDSEDGPLALDAAGNRAVAQSAGLAWGPVKVGNLELKITNPHTGIVPGIGNVNHINFHITKTSTGRDIANYHIVKYNVGNRDCLYVYESVSKTQVVKQCYDNWTSAVGDVVAAAKDVVQAALSEADWLATVTIWAVIIVVLVDLILPMDPIPVLPFSIGTPMRPIRY